MEAGVRHSKNLSSASLASEGQGERRTGKKTNSLPVASSLASFNPVPVTRTVSMLLFPDLQNNPRFYLEKKKFSWGG